MGKKPMPSFGLFLVRMITNGYIGRLLGSIGSNHPLGNICVGVYSGVYNTVGNDTCCMDIGRNRIFVVLLKLVENAFDGIISKFVGSITRGCFRSIFDNRFSTRNRAG
jgi:hypothetical protein